MYAVISGDEKIAMYQNDQGTFKFVLTIHEHELALAHTKVFSNDLDELKTQLRVVEWRVPVEDDEADNDVLLIGV